MPSEVANPLVDFIAKFAKAAPAEGAVAEIRKRYEGATDTIAVLCDCSDSMSDLVGSSGISKFRHLQIALQDLQRGFPKIRLIAFSSTAVEVKTARELEVGGSTNLAAALNLAATLKPRKTIIVSDGLPDSEDDAIESAALVTGGIDAIYCGPDSHPAVQFLRSLCHSAGGVATSWNGRAEISGVLLRMLPAPEAVNGSRP